MQTKEPEFLTTLKQFTKATNMSEERAEAFKSDWVHFLNNIHKSQKERKKRKKK